jgi:glycosyltransferase involved in cell wall biosynthesis
VTPRFSILTPVYDTPADFLTECVESVRAQDFQDWELILVDDCSPAAHVALALVVIAASDPRIRVLTREVNGGIVAASNDALSAATGEFVALLDHDDLLTPTALSSFAAELDRRADVDVLYSDEDKIDDTGRRYDTFYKPDWSPARLASHMYLGHFLALRRSLVQEVGGFRAEYEGSQDYDLALRVTEQARYVAHIRGVRYHWRASANSTAAATSAKPYAVEAGRRAVEDHCRRLDIDAEVVRQHEAGLFRIKRKIDPEPLVSIVIPSRGSAALIDGRFRTLVTGAVRSIVERSTYTNFEVVAVLDRSTPPAVVVDLQALLGDRFTLVWYDRPFNFSDKVNVGVLAASGSYVVLLNDDTEVISPDWIEALLAPALEPDVGMVGAAHNDPGHLGALLVQRECSGVTGACCLIPRDLYLELGGFTLALPGNFNDVDFSMKVTAAGRRIVWSPHAQLFHYESKTRVNTVQAWEYEMMFRRWSARMRIDPYWWTPGMPAPDRPVATFANVTAG